MKKKIAALLLALVMALSLLPASVFAATTPQIDKFSQVWGDSDLTKVCKINGAQQGTFIQVDETGKATGTNGFSSDHYNYNIYVSKDTTTVRAGKAGTSWASALKPYFSYSNAAKIRLYTKENAEYSVEKTNLNAFYMAWVNTPIPLSADTTTAVIELYANSADKTPATTYTFTFIKAWPDNLPTKLEITTPATKLAYIAGNTFSPKGMVIKATYADNTTSEIKDGSFCVISPATITEGCKEVTITLGSAKVTQAINVVSLSNLQGKGTKDEPYKLTSAADLVLLSNFVAAGGATKDTHFLITDDITLPTNWTPIGSLKEGQKWSSTLTEVGYNFFNGSIDGGNHTITVPEGGKTILGAVANAELSNLNIYGKKIDGYGVVEYYHNDRTYPAKTIEINNVTLKSGTHTKYSGFIGGYASGSDPVIIRNSTVEAGVVIGDDGTYPEWREELKSDFIYSWGPTGVKMNDMVGSFAGAFSGTIENCTSAAKVYGRNYVGGIAGFKGQSMGDCIIRNCSFTGEVIATGKFVGGILGSGYSAASGPNTPAATVESCSFTGKVTGATNVGGIFGGEELLKQCWSNGIGLIRANYSNGTITATAEDGVKGGIIGYMNSLDRYTVISDNYYMEGTSDKGIGAVNEANVETKNDHYKRFDDPLGADADKLTASFTAAELASGAVTEKLNTALVGQGWTGTTPTRTTEKHVVGLRSTKLICNPEPTATQNGGLSLSTPITVNYSDGTTEEITLKDCVLTGLDLTKTGYQLCTANYKGYAMVFGVNVKEGGTAPEGVITVTVSVLGDTLHDLTADQCHTLAANNLTPWVTDLTVVMDKDATVLDALQKACSAQGLKLGVVDSSYGGKYINSVTSAAGITLTDSSNKASNGVSYCGWMFTVDGTMPMTTVDATALTDGAELCLYFEDDYSLAYVDSAEKAIDAIVATDCRTIKAAEDAVKYLSPVAIARISNYAKLEEALKDLDKIDHKGTWKVTTPATATTDGLEELICDDCGHVLDSKVIPATGGGVKTGDQGIMLFAGMGMAALLGLAMIPAVRRKKI